MKIRNMILSGIWIVAAAFLFCSCGPSYQERRDDMEKSMQFWVGKTETELVTKWGPPSNVYKLAGGSKELTYRYVNRPYGSYYWGYRDWSYRVERGFTVDSSGTIIAYRWDGF
jgi:hypothetical protein